MEILVYTALPRSSDMCWPAFESLFLNIELGSSTFLLFYFCKGRNKMHP